MSGSQKGHDRFFVFTGTHGSISFWKRYRIFLGTLEKRIRFRLNDIKSYRYRTLIVKLQVFRIRIRIFFSRVNGDSNSKFYLNFLALKRTPRKNNTFWLPSGFTMPGFNSTTRTNTREDNGKYTVDIL